MIRGFQEICLSPGDDRPRNPLTATPEWPEMRATKGAGMPSRRQTTKNDVGLRREFACYVEDAPFGAAIPIASSCGLFP